MWTHRDEEKMCDTESESYGYLYAPRDIEGTRRWTRTTLITVFDFQYR